MQTLFLTILPLVGSLSCYAETFTVDDDGPADFDSIQEAIDAAGRNDEILIAPGIYRDHDNDGVVARLHDKPLTLRASGAPGSAILEYTVSNTDPGQALIIRNAAFAPSGLTTLDGLHIRPVGGDAPPDWIASAAALQVENATVLVRNSTFTNNDGSSFIQSFGDDADVSFNDCTFAENDSRLDLEAMESSFARCRFTVSSARICIKSPNTTPESPRHFATISECHFEDQRTCIQVEGTSHLDMNASTFLRVVPDAPENAALTMYADSTARINDCTFEAGTGLAISTSEARLEMYGGSVQGSSHLVSSGILMNGFAPSDAFFLDYNSIIEGVRFANCSADDRLGSALAIFGVGSFGGTSRVLVRDCEFTQNEDSAILVQAGRVDIFDSLFDDNRAEHSGHALVAAGDSLGYVRIKNNLFRNNGHPSLPPLASTVFNHDMDTVQCYQNKFCGDSGEQFAGAPISAWDNLIGSACWDEFPYPRGTDHFEYESVVTAEAVAVLATDSDTATGGTSDNAIADASFHSFPIQAFANANGVIQSTTPTENGVDFEFRALANMEVRPGGERTTTTAEAQLNFYSRLVVETTEPRVLILTGRDFDHAPDAGWDSWSLEYTVTDTRSGGTIPFIDTPEESAEGTVRYRLSAHRTYEIEINWTLQHEVAAWDFDIAGASLDQTFGYMAELVREGDGEEEPDDEEENDEEENDDEESKSADLNQDGKIDGADLAVILGSWGENDSKYDLNDDGVINGVDLTMLLGSWTGQ